MSNLFPPNMMPGLFYQDGTGLVLAKFANHGALISGSYTLQPSEAFWLVAAGAVLTGPTIPILGCTYRLLVQSGTPSTNPIKLIAGLNNNGVQYPIRDPNPQNLYDSATTVTLRTDAVNPAWIWTGSIMELAQ